MAATQGVVPATEYTIASQCTLQHKTNKYDYATKTQRSRMFDKLFHIHVAVQDDTFQRQTLTPGSAAVERLFRAAGLVMSYKRTRLSDRNFENLVFVKANQWLADGV